MSALKNSARLLIALAGLFAVFFAPPYVPLLCMLLLCLRFRAWEALCIGFLMDMVWLPQASFHVIPFFAIAAIAMVWALEPLRLQLLR
jgi:hypothetical protein